MLKLLLLYLCCICADTVKLDEFVLSVLLKNCCICADTVKLDEFVLSVLLTNYQVLIASGRTILAHFLTSYFSEGDDRFINLHPSLLTGYNLPVSAATYFQIRVDPTNCVWILLHDHVGDL